MSGERPRFQPGHSLSVAFGRKLRIARHVLRIGKALRSAFDYEPTPKAREELRRWLAEHDPHNESQLGDGLETGSGKGEVT